MATAYAQRQPGDGPRRPEMAEGRQGPFSAERMGPKGPQGNPIERALFMLEKRPEVAEHLGITPDQVDQLKAAREASQDSMQSKQKALAEARKALGMLMSGDEVLRDPLIQAIETAGKAETEVRKEQALLMLEIREILGRDLFKKIHQRSPHQGGGDREAFREKMLQGGGDREALREEMMQKRKAFKQDGPDGTGGHKGPRLNRQDQPEDQPGDPAPWMTIE